MIIPTDERSITDEQVFAAFNLKAHGLEKTFAAYNAGDIESAKKHLCDYFKTRSNVHFLFDFRSNPLQPINPEDNPYAFQASLGFGNDLKAFCLNAGKNMMKNIYTLPGSGRGEIALGDNFENMIHFNFLTDNGTGHRNHLDMFVRGQFFEYLAILYHENADKDVCVHFSKVLSKFLETYPLQVSDTSAEANRFQYDEDRDAMSVGFLALTYITLLYTCLPYDAGYNTVFEIIKHLWFLGIQFRRFDTDAYKPYNHHMWERGLIPFLLGTLLPEINDFAKMQKHGAQIVCRHVKEDFNVAGGYNEHSIAYWAGAAIGEMLYRGVSLARLNNTELLDSDAFDRLDKSFTALAGISPPGERYPAIGDNRGPFINPVLRLGVAMTGNKACETILNIRTDAQKTEHSANLDFCNTDVGFVCMRSGLDKKSNYLLMSAKTDCGASGHNHMDMLSLSVIIKGISIIDEPYADFIYRNAKLGSAQRGYLYNMSAHNTVLAFGQSVTADSFFADKWGVYRHDSPVSEFESFDIGAYVNAYHVGYPHCRHSRKVFFSRNGNMLVRDEIARGNRVSEPHIQRWHLAEGCTAHINGKNSVIVEQENLKLLFIWDKPDYIELNNDKDILCPFILDNAEALAPIIDISFSNMQDITTDLLMVPLTMFMLDISDREMPNIELLVQELSSLAVQTETAKIIEKLSNL